MPLAVLAGHATLVAVKGVIFDVSLDEGLARWAGHDVSRLVAVSGGAGESGGVGFDAGLEGLRYEEHQRLEARFLEMVRAVRAVAVLTDQDYARYTRILGSAVIQSGSAQLCTRDGFTKSLQGYRHIPDKQQFFSRSTCRHRPQRDCRRAALQRLGPCSQAL